MLDIRHILPSGKLVMVWGILLTLSVGNASAGAAWSPPKDMANLVVRLADENDRAVRTNAALELQLYGQNALLPLVAAYQSYDPLQRRGAMIGMSLLPTPGLAAYALLDGLDDPDLKTRSLAAQGLALLGEKAAPWLATRLESQDMFTRDAAAFGLKLMGKKAVPALIRVLMSDDPYAQAKAAWLLGRIGTEAKQALPALIRALNVEDIRAMHVIAEAIDLIGPTPDVALHHLQLIGEKPPWSPFRRVGTQASPTLVRLLGRPGTPLAQLAFKALAIIGPPAAPALKDAIRHAPFSQKLAAAMLLVEIDPEAAYTLPTDVLQALQGVKRQPEQ